MEKSTANTISINAKGNYRVTEERGLYTIWEKIRDLPGLAAVGSDIIPVEWGVVVSGTKLEISQEWKESYKYL